MDSPGADEPAPTYVAEAGDDIAAWTETLQQRSSELGLPLTDWPLHRPNRGAVDPAWAVRGIQIQIIASFYRAIRDKNIELVTLLVSQGFISPDCPTPGGQTPLLAAVVAGNGAMVCTLVGLGAQVDLYGEHVERPGWPRRKRTPLQLAAALGRLALVKLLLEDFHADDSLIAPDGQLALRLAADNGHREVVAYLPTRRGGAWRRWKTHHLVAWRRIKKAVGRLYFIGKCLVWYLPKGLFWFFPKYCIVLPLRDAAKQAWKHRNEFLAWCVRQTKRIGRAVRRIPARLLGVSKWVWGGVKATLKALKIAMGWFWHSLERIGKAMGNVALRLVSLLHTTFAAIINSFHRITLKDIWNGICALCRVIFIDIPKAVWASIEMFGEASYKFLESLFGFLGEVIWWTVRGLIELVIYIPRQIWEIPMWCGSSIVKGCQEIMVWVDPKIC